MTQCVDNSFIHRGRSYVHVGKRHLSGSREAELHYFSDWGVVTYRSAAITTSTSTFLSVKSGKLHGRAVYDSVHAAGGPEAVRVAWKHFNAGHEHPDQNSFTFSPGGRRVITDGLYGPKMSYLNNVLLLAPGNDSACTRPWTGQLGDCDHWLRWLGDEDGRAHGEVLTAQLISGVVFVVGEAAGAYHRSLRLSSVRRSLLLLAPNLLLVVDDIRVLADSHVTHVSAFFNNHERRFTPARHPAVSGVEVTFDDGEVGGVIWRSAGGQSPVADIVPRNYSSSRGPLTTSNVNVTYALEGRHTRLVHVVYGARAVPTSLRVVGDRVVITTARDSYNVTVRTSVTGVSLPLCSVVTSRHDTVTFYVVKPQTGSLTNSSPKVGNSDVNSADIGPALQPQRPLYERQRWPRNPQSVLQAPQSPLVRPLHELQRPLRDPSVQSGHVPFMFYLACTAVVLAYCRRGYSHRYKFIACSLVMLSLISLSFYVH